MPLFLEAASAIEAGLSKLPEKDRAFAADLCRKGKKYGLSPKQEFWFNKFYEVIVNGASLEPKKVAFVGGGFSKLVDMFKAAKKHLKYPKIVLAASSGAPVQLALAGPKSKYEGQVQVTDGGKFGSNKYYGRVSGEGEFVLSRNSAEHGIPFVVELLEALAKDPIGTAKKHGQLTGRCCFCNRTLTDEKSTAAGYGPVCAANFGLSESYKAGKSFLESMADAAVAPGDAPESIAVAPVVSAPVKAPESAPAPSQAPVERSERKGKQPPAF